MSTIALTLPPVLTSEECWNEHPITSRLANGRAVDVFVNAYELHLAFGGREEGNWWYDVGEPLASVPVTSFEEAVATYTRLWQHFCERYVGRGRHSCAPEPDLNVCIEDHVAAAFPTERPRYE
jgi:hypothetical protein